MLNNKRSLIALSLAALVGCSNVAEQTSPIAYHDHGYPTKATVENMYDELAFQGATQAYLWGVSILVNDAWRQANLSVAGPNDFVTYNDVEQKYNVITSNIVTPYMLAFPNLAETGPLILEVPAGPTGGILNDIQSRHIGDIGLAGPDQGRGGKYLIVKEDEPLPDNHGADYVLYSRTNLLWIGQRILDPSPENTKKLQEAHKIYPLNAEPETKVLSIENTYYEGWHPLDNMAYWRQLNEIVQMEDFPEEDRYMLQALQRVGIEKGKPFNPSERQIQILEKAADYGKAMAESLSNGRRHLVEPFYGEDSGSYWTVHLGGLTNSQHVNQENGMKEFDGLTSYTWEAFSMSDGMMLDLVGVGSKYLAAYEDADGNWLDGSETYQLTVPANVPAEQFWSFIVYSQKTRTFVQNQDRKPGVTSNDDIEVNDDGSYTITIGPECPEGVPASNFIYSNEGEGWFTYFRLYAPGEAYFTHEWVLPNIEKI